MSRSASGAFAVVVLAAAGFVVSMVQSLVIPIQLELPRLLSASPTDASWVVTATLLGAATAMPVAGRVADVFGKRRALVSCAAILLIGSLVCALSETLAPMIVGRLLQGVSVGYIPVAISFVHEVVPRRMVDHSVAAISAMLGVGSALGLPIAAWLVHQFEWHALFWVSAIAAALILLLTVTVLPQVPNVHQARMDVVGAVALVIGLAALLTTITKGNDWGWTSGEVAGTAASGAVVLALWVRHELRTPYPLVDLRVSASRPVLLTNLAALMVGFGMMVEGVAVPQLMGTPHSTGFGLGLSVAETGLWMAPAGLATLVFAPICSILISRIGARMTLALGTMLIAVGYFSALWLTAAPWQVLIAITTISSGVGLGYAAMPTLILQNVPASQAGAGVGLNGLMRQGGCALAAAVTAVILTSDVIGVGTSEVPTLKAYHTCFIVGGVISVTGAILAISIHSRRGSSRSFTESASAVRKSDPQQI